MSNSSKKDNELEKIDEDQAYFELCQIIAEAIQTQDINLLNARITEWKRKYPWDKFSKNLKSKIEYILNQYYSELIQYIIKSIKEQDEKKEFDQRKALLQLYKLIKNTNDIKILKKEVAKWKSNYPIDDFMKMYAKRAKLYTSENYLEENAFDQEKAFYDLYYTLRTNNTFEELKVKVEDWEKEYSIGDKFAVEDFIKRENDVRHLLNEEYLNSISTDNSDNNTSASYATSLSKQQAAYDSLVVALSTNDNSKVFDWVYKYKDLSFNSFYKNQILVKTAFKYPLSILESNPKLGLDLNNSELSFNEFQNIDSSRKFIIIKFIKYLMDENPIPGETFQTVFKKSETAKHASFSSPVLESEKPTVINVDNIDGESKTTYVQETSETHKGVVTDNNQSGTTEEPAPEEKFKITDNISEDPIEKVEEASIESEVLPGQEETPEENTQTNKEPIQEGRSHPTIVALEITSTQRGFEEIKKLISSDEPVEENILETKIIPVEGNSVFYETSTPSSEEETQVIEESENASPVVQEIPEDIQESEKAPVIAEETSEDIQKAEKTPIIIESKDEPVQAEPISQVEFSDTLLFEINSNIENTNIKEPDSDEYDFFEDTTIEIDPLDLIYKKSQLAKATILVEDTISEETAAPKRKLITDLFKFKNRSEEDEQ